VTGEIPGKEIQIPPWTGWREALERFTVIKEDHCEAKVEKKTFSLWR